MPFDRAYRPVIAGEMLYFGSSADCKVYALDAAGGRQRWTFFTGGPVRFAPAVWKDRLFVASDDGYLYCLAAKDGKLLWKLRGGPAESMVLGNGRMISRWPARGGPAVVGDVVYFAAGIWPSEGIFIYAVDAATGKVLWCNDRSGAIYMPQPHGGAEAKSGVSAQGDLVVCGDLLLVPTGRAVPAAFKLADGEFYYFHLQENRAAGGSDVVAAGKSFFAGNCYFDTATGSIQGKGVKTATVCATPEGVVSTHAGAIYRSEFTQKERTDRKGDKLMKTVLDRPILLTKTPHKKLHSLIVAGETLIAGGENSINVFDQASKKTVFSANVDGMPCALAVAGGRLYVGTDRGVIHCFGADTKSRVRETHHDMSQQPATEPMRSTHPTCYTTAAEQIVRQTGVTEGYCLNLGCGDGSLAYALAKRTKLQICAVDPDPKNVAIARRKLDDAGLYGVRATVLLGDPAKIALPNYFANLVVSGRSVTGGAEVVPTGQLQRLQRPYGGIACIGKPGAMKQTVRGRLDDTGTWTHQYCNPANTNCSTDTLAKGPLGMLWFTDMNFQMPSRHGRGPAPLFLDGRMFVMGIDALRAVDAYNGRMLWVYPLPGILKAYDQEHLMGTAGTGSNYCVTADGVYVRIGGKCLRIDPATGKLLAEFNAPKQPDGKQGAWAYIACIDDTLFGSLADTDHLVTYRYIKSDMSTQFTESLLLFAMDAKDGNLKWTYKPEKSIRNNAIAIGGGKVYLIDRELNKTDKTRRRKKTKNIDMEEHKPGKLVALDAETGRELWKATESIYGTMLALSRPHDVLLTSYQPTAFRLDSELGCCMAAFRASDGKLLWDVKMNYQSRPIVNDRTIYAQPGAWDLLTGKRIEAFKFSRSYGCGILAGSTNLLVYRSATLGYTDLLSNTGTENYGGIRPGCWINTIPVGGIVLMPDATDRCTCSYLIKATIALQPMRD